MFTVDEAWSVIGTANGCESHPQVLDFNRESISKVFWFDAGCNCGSLSSERKKKEAESAKAELVLHDDDEFGDMSGMCNNYCDTWSVAICKLKDGRYIYAQESSDTSGHG
jgi:hypothetical protein